MYTNCTGAGSVRLALRWLMAVMLLATSHVAMAAYCTSPQSATVNSGGSVTFDVSNCDGPDNFGMSDGAQPSHGS
ncbi:hypothetical protein J7431_20430 [Xanthomonas phaseoli pv. dieffenbachiae]|nr:MULTISPECIES: hypothetical protein [Xanthomonas]MBO9749535.1 hypothetical protein [Xanthomonas phaseoli pv. dieffenbachiae]MBO9753096.1 hypothetical protein [Xanthomonas phaseoli pv. dieffenbachiae]MBO9891223.1 hypothetical protein [Xanthomonas sp. D-36-1]OQP81841.1 hypothetical protein IB69_021115 [Xanthomonas citri]